jgi:predicted lipoprotein with Yx(FWY)xxD motif
MMHSRFHIVRASLGAGAVALLVAACGGSGDDGSASIGDSGPSARLVSTTSVDGTSELTDGAGKTLYSTDVEADGQVKCVDACTSFWEPLLGSAKEAKSLSSEIGGMFGVVDRPDSGTQLTYKGLPLYTFAEEGAGELQGNGFTDDFQGTHFVWTAVSADGAAAPTPSSAGGGRYGY